MHKLSILSISTGLLILCSAPLLAEEFLAASNITAVTVFPDRALVTRTTELTAPKGLSTVVIEGLPAGLIHGSLRVEGSGSGSFAIGSIESQRIFQEDLIREDEERLTRELEGLRDERRGLDDQISSSRIRLKFIEALGQEMGKNINEEIVRGPITPETWEKAWTTIESGASQSLYEVQRLKIEKRKLDRKIRRVKKELNQVRTGKRESVTAKIKIEAETAGTAQLKISYQIFGASWTPLYDARLDVESEKVTLIQLAQVRQKTGEEWLGVPLTLSTSRPLQGATLPELEPWFIDFLHLMAQDEISANRPNLALREEMEMDASMKQSRVAGSPKAKRAKAREAVIAATEFSAEYQIPGRSNVPSDNAPHKFTIGQDEMEVELAVRTVPKITPKAYLFARASYNGAAPLLPGPVSVFRDGAFIGNTRIKLLRPDEKFKLSFGVDDKVRVKYRLEIGKRSKGGIIRNKRRVEKQYRITVSNFHDRPIEVSVMDQIPVPQDKQIKVELLKDSTEPTDRDPEGKLGIVTWTHTYDPNEERVIHFDYSVSYPKDQSVPGF